MDATAAAALVAELGRKTSVCWVRLDPGDGREHAVWHVWSEDALLLVSDGDEQQLPGVPGATRAEVTMRSKDNGGRLVTWVGEVATLEPGTPGWTAAAAALAGARLSIPSITETPLLWAETCTLTRIVPTGEVLESPGALRDDDLAATPRPTPATTAGALPWVLHRRQRQRRPLS